jgi:hypothetical protein
MFIKKYIARRKEKNWMIQLENADISAVDFAIAMKPYTYKMVEELLRLENRIKELEAA